MRNILLASAALALLAAPAMAQSVSSPSYYGTLGYSQLDGDSADVGAVTGRFGAKLTPYLGAEAEASFGVGHDNVSIGGLDGKVKETYDVAAYGVATLPVNPNFDLFARVGYGTTELKTSVAGSSVTDSADSWNYGVGANYYLDGQNGVRGDWTRRDFTNGGGEADVYSLSYVRRF
ncbi:porin family protein [uncultured Brevundimonas sp.]|uniref:porin family protein n=1 Tax=uncultured Brevundimonas sp. TaxID=213418 RepID=UPI0030EC351B|tara:strand:+ start:730 stop:1257 length:528 start_codon:yes stop_codon:yes gene_type:complete